MTCKDRRNDRSVFDILRMSVVNEETFFRVRITLVNHVGIRSVEFKASSDFRLAKAAVASVSGFTFAVITTVCIDTSGLHVAVVRVRSTFVNVDTFSVG